MEPSKDPLDELSNVYVERKGKLVHLTFRELHDECLKGGGMMETWDAIGAKLRADNQLANDPGYRPIKPYAGRKKYKRWRGM
jgi:hypothetical protein